MGHLKKDTYYGVTGTLFGIAVIIAIARLVIRVYKFRRVFVDDYFLFLAIVSLIASTGLFYSTIPVLYAAVAVLAGVELPPPDYLAKATAAANTAYAAEVLGWTTIFAVKFSFLFYFRSLIRRVRRLNLLWWCVLAVCTPMAITSMLIPFIECPHVGSSVLEKCLSPQILHREDILVYYTVVVDIVSDLLLISIPVCLLWQTQLSIRQKLSIGVVLCLSGAMITIGIIRAISARYFGAHDQIWTTFWVQVESCVSVIMVCMTAFRTLFVASKRSKDAQPRSYKSLPYKQRLWKKKGEIELPSIPIGATMTGMRTLIRENGHMSVGSFEYNSSSGSKLRQDFTDHNDHEDQSLTLPTNSNHGNSHESAV